MPEVEVRKAIALRNVPGVELAAVGTWHASTGITTFTQEDLANAVGALDCPGVRNPVIKLGHEEEDSTSGVRWDGEPAVGWIGNMHMAGAKIIGDYMGMPEWMVDADENGNSVLASAYPDRSIEIRRPFLCQIGHLHPSVITAVSLLGIYPPGVGVLKSMQDVYALFTEPMDADTDRLSAPVLVSTTVRMAAPERELTPVERQARTDFAALNEQWSEAVTGLIEAWPEEVTGPQAEVLAAQVETAVAENPDGLGELTVAASVGAGLLLTAMTAVAVAAIAEQVEAAAAQGVTVPPPEPDGVALELLALAVVGAMAASTASTAGRFAAQLLGSGSAREIADQTKAHLTGLGDRFLRDQLGGALSAAQSAGRFAVLKVAPKGRYYASEIQDADACELCAAIDGTEFPDLDAAQGAYGSGKFVACLGGPRCRGQLVTVWDVTAEQAGAGPVQALFDPDQRRDERGRWTDGFGGESTLFPGLDPVAGTSVDVDAGTVDIVADGDRLHIGYAVDGGGQNFSGGLSRDAAWALADLIQKRASPDGDGTDGTSSVATYPGGGQDAAPTGFVQIRTTDDGQNVELELLDNDTTMAMTAAEALRLPDPLYRYAVARRLTTESGPLELALTDSDRFAFRMNDTAGQPTEVAFDKKSWAGISAAINLVWEGFDESGDTADPEDEFSVRHVRTNVGKVRVERFGAASMTTADFDRISVTPAEGVDGTWSIDLSGADYRTDPGASALGAVFGLQDAAGIVMDFEAITPTKITASALIRTTVRTSIGEAMPGNAAVRASVSVEEISRQYYESAGYSMWITAMHVDPLELIASDDATGKFYRVPVQLGKGDTFTFDDPQEVAISYVDVKSAAAAKLPHRWTSKAAAFAAAGKKPDGTDVPKPSATGPVEPGKAPDGGAAIRLLAATSSPDAGAPAAGSITEDKEASGMAVDATKLREALGLPADAPQDDVNAALAVLSSSTTSPAATPAAPVTDPAALLAAIPEGSGAIVLDPENYKALLARADQGVEALARVRANERDDVLTKAAKEGRFPVAKLSDYQAMWDKNPDATRDYIKLMPKNSVPTTMAAGFMGVEHDKTESDLAYDAYVGKGAS